MNGGKSRKGGGKEGRSNEGRKGRKKGKPTAENKAGPE